MVLSPGTSTSVPTILFVGDDPSLPRSRLLVFEALGYRVLTAGFRETALELLRLNTVNAVILDYLLHGMRVEETSCQIRASSPRHGYYPEFRRYQGAATCVGSRQRLGDSVTRGTGPASLLEVLEQQLQIVPRNRTQRKAAGRPSFVSI